MKTFLSSHAVVCIRMLDFETPNSRSKTTLLQREPFLTECFIYYQPLPLLITKKVFGLIINCWVTVGLPVFPPCSPQHMHNKTNRWTVWLNCSSKFQENDDRTKNPQIVHNYFVLSDPPWKASGLPSFIIWVRNNLYLRKRSSEKVVLLQTTLLCLLPRFLFVC